MTSGQGGSRVWRRFNFRVGRQPGAIRNNEEKLYGRLDAVTGAFSGNARTSAIVAQLASAGSGNPLIVAVRKPGIKPRLETERARFHVP